MGSAFERLSGPGERHRALSPLIGAWRVAMATHGADGRTTRSEEIRARKDWFGDGRYVREEVSGTFAGVPHAKLTLLGFNNLRHRYEYVTADNYDAVLLLHTSAAGVEPGDPGRIEVFAEYVEAGEGEQASGTLILIRTVIEIVSDDHHLLRNLYRAPDRPERPFLEYDYRRTA